MPGNSPTSRAFKRFLRNKPAVAGMVIILVSVTVALLGYQVTPDSTPDANDQVLQISNKPPGFSMTLLKRAKNKPVERKNFISKMFNGQENPWELIPVSNWRIEGDSIFYQEYAGEKAGEMKKLWLADVAFPLSSQQRVPEVNNGSITINDIHGKTLTLSLQELQKRVEKKNITSQTYWLGTDKYGRDMLSRLVIGVRVSLSIGVVAVIISLLIGTVVGAAAGYFRGAVDEVCMWFINVAWSIPTLLLVIAIQLALGRGFWQVYVAVGLTIWVEVARIIRGQVLGLREMLFIEATRSLGFGHLRTILIHILPNTFGPLMVVTAANFASAILLEAGLSFLGIGVMPPQPSWGGMLSENYGFIIGSNPFLAIIPGAAIMVMVLAFNLVGNGLRDALDVRTSLSE